MSLTQNFFQIIKSATFGLTRLLGQKRQSFVLSQLSESLIPVVVQETTLGALRFYCPGKQTECRARSFLIKEPDTIAWIDSLPTDDVLWDIGANIGAYSLYAALRKLRILAFEPSAGNFWVLSRNIHENLFGNVISPFCLAFNDKTKLDLFFLPQLSFGGALNRFGSAAPGSSDGFRQTTLGFTIDQFIENFQPPFPNHLKIDVDGTENKILAGASKTLQDGRLKSILIEINQESYEDQKTIALLKNCGFQIASQSKQPSSDKSSFSSSRNFLFQRVVCSSN